MKKGKIYKLREICEIRAGKTPSTQNKGYWENGTIPWLTQTEITSQTLITKKFITQKAIKECSIPLTTKNSVLLCNINQAVVFYSGVSGLSCNQQVFILEPDTREIKSNYLYYLLCAEKNKLNLFMRGTIFKSLTKTELENALIFLPSIPEQTQILQKFQIVYNKLFKSEVVYNDFLLNLMKKCLELGDLLFQKYKDSKIKIKDHFQLIAGKSPYASLYKSNKELYELIKKKSQQPGTIKWVNSGILTNCYFLTEKTNPSKLINEELVNLCKLNCGINNSILVPGVYFDTKKITWNQTNDYIIGQEIINLNYLKGENQLYKNATLFFALRSQASKIIHNCCYGSAIKNLDFYLFKNYNLNWVSNPKKQKIFFTILDSKLAEIKDLHKQIKDLHKQIKDLLLLKYFGKK